MGDHLVTERYCWFHRQIQKERYPNAPSLARHFELSEKTAQRTIQFMRLRLGAPLEFDSSRRGYYYTQAFELPLLQVSQNELLAILLAQKLLSDSAGGFIGQEIRTFGRKLFAATDHLGLNEERITAAFSSDWHGYTPAEATTFRIVADALIGSRDLTFDYFAPSTNEHSRRSVEPHHLQHYLGTWFLLAWCADAFDWRKFNLGHMRDLVIGKKEFRRRPLVEWQAELAGAFGIFQGGQRSTVRLRFSAFRARWVRHQHWHAEQTSTELPDGGIELCFPVTDFRELKLEIQKYGADVEVLEPVELRASLRDEIEKMARVYREK